MAVKTFVLTHATTFTQEVNCWDDDVDFSQGTAFTSSLSDTITLSDAKVFGIGLIKADTITLSDSFSRAWTALLSLTDTVTLSDAISNAVGKVFSDIITLSDAAIRGVGQAISDTITLSDSAIKSVGKALSDTISLSDAITTLRSLGLLLYDTITMSDSVSYLADLISSIPRVIATTLRKAFGISRPDKPSGTTRHTDKTNIV